MHTNSGIVIDDGTFHDTGAGPYDYMLANDG
jgi:hypothetical protein